MNEPVQQAAQGQVQSGLRRQCRKTGFWSRIQLRSTVLATRLEVADSGPKRNKGLLGRDGLAPGEGLWIVPCESVHTFFMRFPIDLVYLDRKNTVKKVRSAVGAMAAFGLPFGALHS